MVVQPLLIIPKLLLSSGYFRKWREWFLELGKPNNGGTKIFSVSGHVNKPGIMKCRWAPRFKDLLEMAGGVRNGIN